jgi:outer membrane lipoprotein-sorting protein
MLRNRLMGAFAALLAAGQLMAQGTAPKPAEPAAPAAALPTVDEVIAKHVAARGGMDKLKSVQTLRMNGRMTMGPGIEAPVAVEVKRPQHMRMEMQFQGMTLIQAYDGKSGWMIMPFGGRTDPQPMSPDDVKDAEDMADIDGVLVDYKAKGHTVEMMGREKVEGTDAYKLKVNLKNGDVRYVFLEADSFMEIRNEGKRKIRGSEVEAEASFGDFKEVGGIIFPHSVEQNIKGNPQKQSITFDKIDLNAPIDDSRFKMPAPAAPSPAPSPAKK